MDNKGKRYLSDFVCVLRQVVDYWKRRGVSVVVWTLNKQIEKEYFTSVLGVDIETDTIINPEIVKGHESKMR